MIAKLIVKGKDRAGSDRRGKKSFAGISYRRGHTTIPFHLYMLDDQQFLDTTYDLAYIDQLIESGCTFKEEE